MQRSDDATLAKHQMLGLSREDVLACMGPPKKKAHDGQTEVWSYLSGDRHGEHFGTSVRSTASSGYGLSSATHDSSFCTVNVVMKDGIVKNVTYNGPTSNLFYAPDSECGYAVANCVTRGGVKE